MLPTNNSYYSPLLLIPTVQAIAIHGSATINGGQEERPPPQKRDGGGICRTVVRSPAFAVAPHGNNNADDQRSVEATREPSPDDDKLQAT